MFITKPNEDQYLLMLRVLVVPFEIQLLGKLLYTLWFIMPVFTN